jgi:hypothetical protein
VKQQVCTLCEKPSISGLIRGRGKCQYHWNLGCWGKDWADKVRQDQKTEKESKGENKQ